MPLRGSISLPGRTKSMLTPTTGGAVPSTAIWVWAPASSPSRAVSSRRTADTVRHWWKSRNDARAFRRTPVNGQAANPGSLRCRGKRQRRPAVSAASVPWPLRQGDHRRSDGQRLQQGIPRVKVVVDSNPGCQIVRKVVQLPAAVDRHQDAHGTLLDGRFNDSDGVEDRFD